MEKIGFIGLGIMGRPMALNLIKAGYSVLILKTSGAAKEVVAAGAKSYGTISALAADSDIVITMLPDSPEVENVVYGKDGIIEGIQPGSIFVDMSTIAPATAIKMYKSFHDKNVEALDAPVSGGQVGAENATISIMVGGREAAFNKVLPLFNVMGKSAVLIGDAGAGQTTKACNQIIVGMTIQAVAEAFALAKKAKVDIKKMREALLGGFAQSRILDLHGQRIIDDNFKPGFKVKLHRKDMNIALQTAMEYSVPLPGSAQVAANMDALIAQGKGELDHSSLYVLLAGLSGI